MEEQELDNRGKEASTNDNALSNETHEQDEMLGKDDAATRLELSEAIDSINLSLQKIARLTSYSVESISPKLADIEASLQGLTSYQADGTKRLRRFEEGYDFQIFKNFTKQIIREIYSLENLLEKSDNDEKKRIIQDVIDGLVELLDRNSITQILPDIGTVYAGQEKYAECASIKVFTEDAALVGRIAAIVHSGYLYEFNDGNGRVLSPAKVLIFSNDKEQCKENTPQLASLASSIKKKIHSIDKKYQSYFDEKIGDGVPIHHEFKNTSFHSFFVIAILSLIIVVLGFIIYKQYQTIDRLSPGNDKVEVQSTLQKTENRTEEINSTNSSPDSGHLSGDNNEIKIPSNTNKKLNSDTPREEVDPSPKPNVQIQKTDDSQPPKTEQLK
jgi:hypothetical protein